MSFDIQLLGVDEENGPNSFHLRAVQDSLEDPNKQGLFHLRASVGSKESRKGHKLNLKMYEESREGKQAVEAMSTRNGAMKKLSGEFKPDCPYHYPEEKEMEFILSNMMNELTQVFVKANNWLKDTISRRMNKVVNADEIRRVLDSRFKISHQKRRDFFEDIYHNMTDDYRSFYNKTALRVSRSNQDDCQNQEEIKKVWHDVLERSMKTLNKAVRHCVSEYLSDQRIHPASKLGVRVNSYLTKELTDMRSNQLKLICEKFQFCYDEILQTFRSKTYLRANKSHR